MKRSPHALLPSPHRGAFSMGENIHKINHFPLKAKYYRIFKKVVKNGCKIRTVISLQG
jgi:hypothetical protein